MAPSKKNSKSSQAKKNPSVKKTPSKKPSSRKKSKKKTATRSTLKRDIFTVLGLFLIISLALFTYFLGQSERVEHKTEHKSKVSQHSKHHSKKAVKKETVKKTGQKHPADKVKTVLVKENTVLFGKHTKKPKLVIIIDDVHTRAQMNAIKALKLKITPSIFPPYKLSPNSHLLAQGLEHYMIHLPMESGNKQFNKQYKTLKVSFSNKKIENRIKELRLLFPKAKFINNHTGSVFTSDYGSMHLAYKIMRENGFVFLDSKTVNTTKVKEIAHAFGDVYVARDIFIDNEHTVPYIHQQLKKAVKLANKKGYAIAIGHPHKVTMQALATAKDILKDVELVYIDGLYK